MITHKYRDISHSQNLIPDRLESSVVKEIDTEKSQLKYVSGVLWKYTRKVFSLLGRVLSILLEGPPDKPSIPRIPT